MPHQKKRKRQQPGRFLNMLILVFIVLIVFEGKLLINIFQKDSLKSQVDSQIHELLADSKAKEPETKVSPETEAPAPMTEPQTEAVPVSAAIVPSRAHLWMIPILLTPFLSATPAWKDSGTSRGSPRDSFLPVWE